MQICPTAHPLFSKHRDHDNDRSLIVESSCFSKKRSTMKPSMETRKSWAIISWRYSDDVQACLWLNVIMQWWHSRAVITTKTATELQRRSFIVAKSRKRAHRLMTTIQSFLTLHYGLCFSPSLHFYPSFFLPFFFFYFSSMKTWSRSSTIFDLVIVDINYQPNTFLPLYR